VFIATELHKGLGPLFSPKATDELKAATFEKLTSRLGYVVMELGDKRWLLGDDFTVADAYAFYFLRTWQRFFEKELSPALRDYYERVAARPAVKGALEAEFGSPNA
jgi:glutathione S-transferase